MLSGDTLQIRRIMLNLFSNAIKYNKRGGRIDTYVKELSFDGMCAAFEFRITDTGVGMSKEYIKEELFKPFTQEINDDGRAATIGDAINILKENAQDEEK
jgi:signal transduction histidine kinase